MNRHQNKNRTPKIQPANLKPVDFDHMPKEVATEMLCAPKARLTNRERKACMAARETRYTSTREPISKDAKVATKLKGATWLQLFIWNKRATNRRDALQRAYKLAQRTLEKPNLHPGTKILLERQSAVASLQAVALDAFRDLLEDEVKRRQDFIANLQGIVPSLAAAVESKLCPSPLSAAKN
jgi:hypothetical protein